MKKLKMFFAGALLAIAGNAAAQTVTLTANEAADKNGGWTLQVKAPADIAGWQMLVNLPEGLSIKGKDLTVGGATFTQYDVVLPTAYSSKYQVVGTQTAEGGYFLFCFPLAESYATGDLAKQAGSGDGDICTIKLTANPSFRGPADCTITNICATDEVGSSKDLQGVDATLSLNNPKGDANSDVKTTIGDAEAVIQHILGQTYDANADINVDTKVSIADVEAIIQEILK